ncbi:hypothetical protein BDQ17DRAFT_1425373 [Cyathus striatus]|nr:hypothetical protein BDQ17DRAFT_1425373 [Cyathus striatus]
MHPSLRVSHQPLIRFIGKRVWSSTPEAPHAHPAAPAELREHFGEFLKKIQSSSPSSSQTTGPSSEGTKAVYNDFWEAPSRFWRPRVRELEDTEMEAIMSGGASAN